MDKSPELSRLYASLVIALASTIASGVSAQGREDLILEEVIVVAQKREQNVQDIPVSVTAVNAETIAQLGIQNTADIVRLAPSLTVIESNHKANSSFSIRGIGTNTYGIGVEQAVATIIDDVALVQQGQSLANLVDVERIEILRGPQSTLFGKASSAGVINITTKQPSEEFEGTVELTATDEEAHNVLGSISGPLGDSLGYRLTGFWNDRDGYIQNLTEGYEDLNGEESQGFRGKLRWAISDTAEATLNAHYSEGESQCCGMNFDDVDPEAKFLGFIPEDFLVGITPSPENRKIRQDTLPNEENDSQGASLRLSFDIGEFNLISVTAYDEWEYINNEDVDFGDLDVLKYLTGGTQHGGFAAHGERDSEFVSQELRLLSPSYDKYDYLLGFYYSDSDINRSFFRVLPLAPADWAGSSGSEYYAIFGQFNWRFTGETSLSLGLRYFEEEISATFTDFADPGAADIDTSDSDDDVVGKISLQHFLDDYSMIFVSYTRGYKGQAYDVTVGFDEEKAENPVAPEISDSYELGLKSTFWDQRMQLNLTAFYAIYDDFQVQTTDATSPVIEFNLDNVGELETQGVELESVALLSEQFTFTFNAAYIDAAVNEFAGAQCYPGQAEEEGCVDGRQDIDNGTLPTSPEWKYTAILDYQLELNSAPFDFFANVLYTWQDEVIFNINQHPLLREDSYGITNLRAGIIDKSNRYEVTAFVNNAFDESYRGQMGDLRPLYDGKKAVIHVIPRNAQRYWGVKVKFNF